MKRIGILRLMVLAFGLVVLPGASAQAELPQAPDFALTTLEGKAISKALLQGKPALLMFWASWCGTCQKELPNVKAFYEQHQAKGLQAVAIGFQDDEAAIRGYVNAHRSTFVFPAAYDGGDKLSALFRARATPTFVLLDGQGRIVMTHTGGGVLQNPSLQKFMQAL